jgi:hypothetical protein
MIIKSDNKMKTTWRIIKTETNKTDHKIGIHLLKINNRLTCNQDIIARSFNKYFTSVADTVVNNIKRDSNEIGDNLKFLAYLFQHFEYAFPNIQ